MNRPLSHRERWIIAAAPALLLALVYVMLIARPTLSRLADHRAAIAKAQQDRVDPVLLGERREDYAALEKELRQQKQIARSLEVNPTTAPAAVPSTSMHAVTASDIALRMQRQGMQILSTQMGAAATNATAGKSSLWRVEYLATFTQTIELLRELKRAELAGIPASIAMEPIAGQPAVRKWTLWIEL